MTAVYILLIILSIIALLLLIPVRIILRINMEEKEVTLKYAFYKKTIYPAKEIPKEDKHEPIPEDKPKKSIPSFEFFKEIKDDAWQFITKILSYMIKHGVKIRELNISARFGTGDPADTGILSGAVYGTVYNLIGLAERNGKLEKWNVDIEPNFDEVVFTAGIYAELRTRLVHFLIMLIIVMKHVIRIGKSYFKTKKNGEEKQNG